MAHLVATIPPSHNSNTKQKSSQIHSLNNNERGTTDPANQKIQQQATMSSSSSSVTYSSTRGEQTGLDFRSVVIQGLARDRGLFVPDTMPTVTQQDLEQWRALSFPDLAVQVIAKFVKDDQVPLEKLKDIVHRSCAAFRETDVTPLKHVGGHAVLVCID